MDFILSANGSLVEPKITDCSWMCYQRDLRNVYLSQERIFGSLLDLCKLKPLLLGAYFLRSFVLYWPDWTFFVWFNPVSLNVCSRSSFACPDKSCIKFKSSKPHSHASSKLPHVEKGRFKEYEKWTTKWTKFCAELNYQTDRHHILLSALWLYILIIALCQRNSDRCSLIDKKVLMQII